mgnify:CR=1 FL=1
MTVAIGRMNETVIIQRKTTAADATGQMQETWRNVSTVKGAVDSLSSREVFNAAQASIIATMRVTIWYRRDVHANAGIWRLKLADDRELNIVAALKTKDTGPPQLELLCSEVSPWPGQS